MFEKLKSSFSKFMNLLTPSKTDNYLKTTNPYNACIDSGDKEIYDDIFINDQFYKGKVTNFHNTQMSSHYAGVLCEEIRKQIIGEVQKYKYNVMSPSGDSYTIEEFSPKDLTNSYYISSLESLMEGVSALGGGLLKCDIVNGSPNFSVVHHTQFYPTFSYGKLIAVDVFLEVYSSSTQKEKYLLKETRKLDNNGRATIQYNVFKIEYNAVSKKETEKISNDSLPDFVKAKLNSQIVLGSPEFIFNGEWLGVSYFKNKPVNKKYKYSNYGESDIQNIQHQLLVIDRTHTLYFEEMESAKAKTFFPSSYLKRDINTGVVATDNISSEMFIHDGSDYEGKAPIITSQYAIRQVEFEARINFYKNDAREMVGVFPIKSELQVQKTAEQVTEENEIIYSTIRARRLLFVETLNEFLTNYFKYTGAIKDADSIVVTLPELGKENVQTRIKLVQTMVTNKLCSIEYGVLQIRELLTEESEEFQLEIARIFVQNGFNDLLTAEMVALLGIENTNNDGE